MGMNTSGLAQYIDQNKKDVMTNFVVGANTFATKIKTVEGIKGGSEREMKFFNTTLYYQLGADPQFSGDVSVTKKNIGTVLHTATDEWTPNDEDFQSKFGVAMAQGANGAIDDAVINAILNNIAEKVRRDVAHTAWCGSYGTPSSTLDSNVTGWLKRLTTTYANDVYGISAGDYTGHTQALTTANIISAIDTLMLATPSHMEGQPIELRMGGAALKTLKIALRNANLYNFGAQSEVDGFELPGFDNVKVVRDDGLSGVKAIVAVPEGSLVFGCDLASDQDNIIFFEDTRLNKEGYRLALSIGTEVVFPENIGLITWA